MASGELVWTSKIGYRTVDHREIEAGGNAGVRFWHLGRKLSFNPSRLGLNFTGSQTWADIVLGGRVQLPMGDKAAFELLGDVGGWNAPAKQDYPFAAVLGYKIRGRCGRAIATYLLTTVQVLSRRSIWLRPVLC